MTGSNVALYSEAGDKPRASLAELAEGGASSLDLVGDNGAGCKSSSCAGAFWATGLLEATEVETSDIEPYLPVCMAGSLDFRGLP
jgi:hypothetical protein